MTKLTGVSFGPIIESLSYAESPASLWFTSYVFSYLGKTIYDELKNDYEIISPQEEDITDGVGLYHDRIIFETTDENLESISKKVDGALTEVSNKTGIDKNYFSVYITQEEADDTEVFLKLSHKLDCLENMPRLENCPPIFKVFQADDSTGVNNKVSALAGKLNLKEEKQKQVAISIKDLLKNNGADSNFKYHNYYAILQADGDRIGAKIVQAGTKEFKTKITIPMFEYVKQAVELVKNFGGRSIYAGGDDLLAIVPLKKELLTCCWNLAERFNTKMNSSLSFGLAIVYEKYPLYEALEIARNNLFQRAKKERNELSLTLIKHSGQTIEFDIDKFNQQDNNKMKIIMDGINMDTDEQFFTTAMHKCFQCKTLLDKAKREEKTDMVFKNILDSEDKHGKDMSKQIGLIANVYKEFGADKFEYALRFIKFFHEKGKS